MKETRKLGTGIKLRNVSVQFFGGGGGDTLHIYIYIYSAGWRGWSKAKVFFNPSLTADADIA